MADTAQKLIDIIGEQMGVPSADIRRETRFIEDLNVDSLDTIELIMECEDEFEISIPDGDADGIETVGDAIDFIALRLSK